MRVQLARTAAASNGVPSLNFRLGLSLIVHVMLSFDFTDSASRYSSAPLGGVSMTSASYSAYFSWMPAAERNVEPESGVMSVTAFKYRYVKVPPERGLAAAAAVPAMPVTDTASISATKAPN